MLDTQPLSDSNSDLECLNVRRLDLCCFNVRGLQSNLHYIRHLLSTVNPDYIAISEHWLHSYNISTITHLHKDYRFIANSAPQVEDHIFCRPQVIRGYGGVALGWKRNLPVAISPIPYIHRPG